MEKNGRRVAIINGCRTPFLKSGTGYGDTMAWELGRYTVKDLVNKTGIPTKEIDHVTFGTVAADIATTNVAREISLGAGLPKNIPAHTCTVACISANMAITNAVNFILSGNADVIIAGGVETFSDADIKISKKYRKFLLDLTMYKRPKTLAGKLKLLKNMRPQDFIVPESPAIAEFSTGVTMGQNAERLAKRLGITRKDQDDYAVMSHQRAIKAIKSGVLKKELTPVVIPGKAQTMVEDNGPRADATIERMEKLRPAFDKKFGTVTAANSSFLSDGASAVLLMSEEKAKALGFTPLAYIRSYAYTGQDLQDELLLGPAFAIPKALKKAGLKFSEIKVLEIHEAFASQMVANIRCLESAKFAKESLGLSEKVGEVDMENMNTYGGSLSIGHPFGATGGRLLTTCVNRMKENKAQFGIVAGCAAGAVGNAIVLENAE